MTSVICGRPYSRSCASALKATNVSKVSKCAAAATSSSYTSFRGPVSLSSAWSVSKSTSSPRSRSVTVRANFGKDSVLGSWVDLANFVSSDGAGKKLAAFEDLAYKIGGEVYVDVNGWHLYIKDIKVASSTTVKMHNVLGQQIGEKVLASGRVDEQEIKDIIKSIPLSLGGGTVQVSLLDSIGKSCMYDLTRAIEDWMDDR
eukprot:CAMPEP_0197483024 /NCGR_PEP_ID=MMETSP1309-20131121/56671_1 /TAXON_ID=464262 /ORGANISM="Genus nov. species nov., Strain RCC998" /LENGTH=200 /DNA_ID=CAMNT_0043025607 /DNA_START=326 /DNA_END=925 /DNA_ORIENTATION=-